MRTARNCDGENPSEVLFFEWEPSLKRCPWSVIDNQAMAYFELWRDWKMLGVLPYEGGLLDQPLHIFQAIKACELISVEQQNKELENISKQTGGANG